MNTPDVLLSPFYSLPSTNSNIFCVQESSSDAVRRLHAIIKDLHDHLTPRFCDDLEHIMEGVVFKRSAPLRHFRCWIYVKDVIRHTRKVDNDTLKGLISTLNQKLSSSYAPRSSVLLYVLSAIVARLRQFIQICHLSCCAADAMIGHMEMKYWLALSRLLIGLVADISSRAKFDVRRSIDIFNRLREWTIENGEDLTDEMKSVLSACSNASQWLYSSIEGLDERGGKRRLQADPGILGRLIDITSDDIVATRVEQALKRIEDDERRRTERLFDMGEEIVMDIKEEEEEEDEMVAQSDDHIDIVERPPKKKNLSGRKMKKLKRKLEAEQAVKEEEEPIAVVKKKKKKIKDAVEIVVAVEDDVTPEESIEKRKKKKMMMMNDEGLQADCPSPAMDGKVKRNKKKKSIGSEVTKKKKGKRMNEENNDAFPNGFDVDQSELLIDSNVESSKIKGKLKKSKKKKLKAL